MSTKYERVAGLVSHIRNAKYGEMVKFSEQLIDSGEWRDFKSPRGVRFRFLDCEYDYFLAAMEADATTLRHAYIHASADEPSKLMRLADITGKGTPCSDEVRRPRAAVAAEYADEPSGAGRRIEEWANQSVVTDRTATLAGDGRRRHDYEKGRIGRTPPKERTQRWDVRWHDDRSAADAIADRLLRDPKLAHQVYNRLRRELRTDVVPAKLQSRRSEAINGEIPARERAPAP